MRKSTQALLLSALVFPGCGHFLLKKYPTAAILFVTAAAGTYFLIEQAITKAQGIAEKIQRGEVALDIDAITALVTSPATEEVALRLSIATYALILSWIIAIVDSYRIGRSVSNSEQRLNK